MRGDPCPFDPDFYDAMLLVERAGCARFRAEDLARALRISPRSVGYFIRRGVLEQPAYYEEASEAKPKFPVWTPEQVARAALARGLV